MKMPVRYLLAVSSIVIRMVPLQALPQKVFSEALPAGIVIADKSGVQIDASGRYWIDMPEILPAKVYQKKITIRNVDLKEAFSLKLRVKDGSKKGTFDFYDAVQTELKLDGERIYRGGVLGTEDFDWTQQSLDLGKYHSGESKVLEATFTVKKDIGLKSYEEESEQLFLWQFIATSLGEEQESQGTVDNKKHGFLGHLGEKVENWLYQVCALLLFIVCLLVKYYQKKKN